MRNRYCGVVSENDKCVLDAKALEALANPTRILIVAAIGPRGTTGDRLAARFPELAPDMFAWHLQWLRRNQFVTRQRATTGDRRLFVYRLNYAAFRELSDRLEFPAGSYLAEEEEQSCSA